MQLSKETASLEVRAAHAIAAYLRRTDIFPAVEIGTVSGFSESTGTDEGDALDTIIIELAEPIAPVFREDSLIIDDARVEIRGVLQTEEFLTLQITSGVASSGTAFLARTSAIRAADDPRAIVTEALLVVRIFGFKEPFVGCPDRDATLLISLDSARNLITPEDGATLSDASRLAAKSAHDAMISALELAMENEAAIGQFINTSNTAASPNHRPSLDLTIIDLNDPIEPGGSAGEGCYSYELRREITLSGIDYPTA